MKNIKHNSFVLMALVLPFVVLCLLIVRAEYNAQSGEEWNFELRGYDPRDLLRGHYMQFSLLYDWQADENECTSGSDCCLCLTKNETPFPKVHKTVCTIAKTQCDGYILPEKQNVLNRYYIPEASAQRAESLLRQAWVDHQAYMKVSINNGEPVILDLIINEQSINHILKQE